MSAKDSPVYLIRIGYRTLNLEFLIKATDSHLGAPPDEAPPDGIRMSVYPGEQFDVGGDDAARLRLYIEDYLRPLPKGGDGGGPRQPPTRPKGARLTPRSSTKSSPREE